MWELVIIWESGDVEIHEYDSEVKATVAGQGFKFAFGHQVEWFGVRKKGE